jgi:Hydrogenase formation hypA family
LDGFLGPGHASMVIGTVPYGFIAEHYGKPIVVAGFERLDILQSIAMVLRQLAEERCVVENQYRRIVPETGNGPALAAISRVFELREFFEWRNLGSIDHSGVCVRAAYARYDAERKFSLPGLKIADPKGCKGGEVLKGMIKPWQCKVFGGACTPATPLGALMVSTEGACAAYYNYGGARVAERRRAARHSTTPHFTRSRSGAPAPRRACRAGRPAENVGNLICPALFDLSKGAKVVMLSVTEGDDKPLKCTCSGLPISSSSPSRTCCPMSISALTAVSATCERSIRSFVLSAITGERVGAWHDWLKAGGSAAVQASV